MLIENLERLSATYLQQVCAERYSESVTLDFKRALPGNSDKEKVEILKDVCALANASGGDLVYGIAEDNGAADSIAAIASEPSDSAERRLLQVLEAGLEPRVQGTQIRAVEVEGGYVLVVRVPASFDGPHCIRSNSNRRFVVRNGTTTSDMSYEQIRAAFDRTATLAEKARLFIADRRALVAARKTVAPIQSGPVWLIHLVPIEGIAERRRVDLEALSKNSYANYTGRDWGGVSRHFSFDGLTIHPPVAVEDGHFAYTHIFRNSSTEAAQVGGGVSTGHDSRSEVHFVWSLDMSLYFYRWTEKLIAATRQLGFEGPALLGYALLSVEGYQLGVGDQFFRFARTSADRPDFLLPETWVERLDKADIAAVTRPVLDILWQSFGFERCPHFNSETGTFEPPRR